MSDESRTSDPEPTAVPESTGPAEPTGPIEVADSTAPTDPGAAPQSSESSRAPETEHTGIIDLHDTRAIPSGAGSASARDDAWFDVFGGEHPTEGAGVPARADSSWGSDRADAVAEQAHRSAYAPPVAAHVPSSAPADSPGAGPASSTDPGAGAQVGGDHPAYVGPVPHAPAGEPGADAGSFPPGGVPLTDAPGAPRRGRGRLAALVVGLCLLSGIVGGVAGQLAQDRIHLAGTTLPEPGPGATQRPAGSVANIAAVALPSIVTIKVDAGSEGSATGSGFVIDGKGHVLTNNHVVEPGVNGDIQIVLSNGDTEKATIVGRDASYDLAVLKIQRTDLTPLQLGQSDKVVVGDQVIAIGAPLGLDQTVTTGIVSALNRPVTPGEGSEASFINAIQTDAAINPGNSGGPLLDMSGKVIGVNSAIARVPGTTGSTGGSIGLGFAIPSDQARRTADQLIATGKATHPVIGVKLDRTFSGDGAQVVDSPDAVTSGGPAAKAGVKAGDVIIGFEGKRIRTPDQLIVSIRARAVGDTVSLKVQRDGKELDLQMTLEADPAK